MISNKTVKRSLSRKINLKQFWSSIIQINFFATFLGKHDYICVPRTLDDFLGLVRDRTASGAFTPVMLGWISDGWKF